MAESEEELKSFLIRVKEESEKAGWKLSIQKTKIMASGPITSWQPEGATMETVKDFILGNSKITAGEGNGNPHQHSCLKNPRDRAWWTAVYGVAQSQTQLKQFNSSSSSSSRVIIPLATHVTIFFKHNDLKSTSEKYLHREINSS